VSSQVVAIRNGGSRQESRQIHDVPRFFVELPLVGRLNSVTVVII